MNSSPHVTQNYYQIVTFINQTDFFFKYKFKAAIMKFPYPIKLPKPINIKRLHTNVN